MDRETCEQAYRSALEDAAKQLSYRTLSASALRKKLIERRHTEDAAEYAAAWLEARGLLSDARFADQLVESYEKRGYGPARIRQELRRRGVDAEAAAQAMEDFSADQDRLIALLDKRLKGDLSDRRAVDKAVAFLQRRGFSWEDIRKALRAYGAAETEGWE